MSRTSMFALGALGGCLPILVSLLTVDVAPFIDNLPQLSMGNWIGYALRILVLLTLGGIIAALHSEVANPMALVQLGVAAPALITSYINGTGLKLPSTTLQNSALSIVSKAYAESSEPSRPVVLAGGFVGDITDGFSTRLDRLQLDNALRENNVIDGAQLSPSNQIPMGQQPPYVAAPPPSGWGAYCLTPLGRYGPGPILPLNVPCVIPTPQGMLQGFVSP